MAQIHAKKALKSLSTIGYRMQMYGNRRQVAGVARQVQRRQCQWLRRDRAARCCSVTAWYHCRLPDLSGHPQRAPLRTPSTL